ncbi:hypothetical protein [Tropicibacter sp. Alg240-R139]|uniref:hypothetical protein n=1 Tax=Tropicibacter sp. Alg240-R139 TaxID=2305991 RepID=UPI0013E09D35|nr:hypothetical protein [Tropicibacter sp. Alg240-R139]
MKKFLDSLLANPSAAAFFGCVIGACFIILTGTDFNQDIKRYGTFALSALVALFASAVSLAGVFSNINNQNENYKEQRLASLKAAKATLPLALSQFSQSAREATALCLKLSEDDSLTDVIEGNGEAISILKETIEYSDDTSGRWIAAIIARFQVLSSNTNNRTIFHSRENFYGTAADWIVFTRMVGHCFDYARSNDPKYKIPEDIKVWDLELPLDVETLADVDTHELRNSLEKVSSRLTGRLEEFEGGRVMSIEARQSEQTQWW